MPARPASTLAVCLALSAAATAHATEVVNLGHLFATSGINPAANVPLTAGPYNRVTFTTNWVWNSGTATADKAALNFNANNNYAAIIAGLLSASGFNNSNSPSTLTAVCKLTIPVSFATPLKMIFGQLNTPGTGNIADWNNTTLTFSYVQSPKPIPTGIALEPINNHTGSNFSITTTGGGGFDPVVGLYSSEGYLIASNIGAAFRPPEQTGLLPGTPPTDPGLTDLIMPPGSYAMFIGGAGTTFTPDDFVANVPPGAPGGTLTGNIGGTPFTDTFAPGEGHWYNFDILVPEPASLTLLTVAPLAATPRRRRSI